MKIKVSELKGEKLAEWVARAQGWSFDDYRSEYSFDGMDGFGRAVDRFIPYKDYRPDINGGQAMELAKKFTLIINFEMGIVREPNSGIQYTDIINIESAICRAVVASEYGEYVEDK